MSSKIKKRRDKLARQALDKKITVAEAQRRAGGKYARKAAAADLAKSQQARADQLTKTMSRAADAFRAAQPLTQDDLIDAVRAPLAMPVITKAAGPQQARREDPQRAMAALKAAGALRADSPVRPAAWAGTDRELQRTADIHPDPREREAARQALAVKGVLPGAPAPREAAPAARALAWAPGPDGTFAWRPMPEPGPLDFGIAVPGTAGR